MNDEATAVAEFLKQKSVVKCPPAFAAAVAGAMPIAVETQRLAELELQPWLTGKAAQQAAIHSLRGRKSRRR